MRRGRRNGEDDSSTSRLLTLEAGGCHISTCCILSCSLRFSTSFCLDLIFLQEELDALPQRLQSVTRQGGGSFCVSLSTIGIFRHPLSVMLWVGPSEEAKEKLVALQSCLKVLNLHSSPSPSFTSTPKRFAPSF